MRVGLSRFFGAIVVLGVLQSSAFGAVDVAVLGPGLHTATVKRDARPGIDYAISVPPTYDRTTQVPLVLALHFGVQGGSSRFAGRDLLQLLIAPGLAELGAILVAPDALEGESWNSPQNEEAVLWLLDSVMRVYRIDPKKVIVTGFSMGGAGTWHLAGKYPERFCAAVPVAGRPPAAIDSWRVPVFAVHSIRDRVVPIEATAARIEELKRLGVRAELLILDRPSHFQTSAHAEGVRQAVAWLREIWR